MQTTSVITHKALTWKPKGKSRKWQPQKPGKWQW